MKKIIFILIAALLLSGCNSQNTLNKLDQEINTIASSYFRIEASNHKKYYNYYIEPTMRVKESTQASSMLISDSNEIIMNLNIATVVANKYYNLSPQGLEERIVQDNLIKEISGEYVDKNQNKLNYRLRVYEVDDFYIAYLKTPYADLYANVYLGDLIKVSSQMLIIAKSLSINEEKIISENSNRSEIDYIKEQIELFEIVVPENGRIEEILQGANSGLLEPTPTPEITEGEDPELNPEVDPEEN